MPRPERPLDDGDDALREFAADLRLLREKAGGLAYRELGRRAHYSAGTLSEAAGGRKLPSLAVTLAYVRACGGDEAEWEARWHTITADGDGRPNNSGTENAVPPYAGLTPFGPEDADRFFGREPLVEKIVSRLSRNRFVAVLGASGSGKSSLLRAGLLPAVKTDTTLLLTPGAHPLQECAVRMGAELGLAPGGLLTEFTAEPRNLGLVARQLLAARAADGDFVLVVDQFEEVFTLCHDAEERARFIAALVAATTEPHSRTRVVLGVRTDFYTHCAQHPELVNVLQESQILVGPMTTEELRLAITQPAISTGNRVETALVSRLIADATGQPGVLPLLSHALLETWQRRRGTTLTLAGYESTGGIERAVAQTSELTYTTLNDHQKHLARQIFLRLTALGEGTEDTKRRITASELDNDDPDVTVVLGSLASARLITLDDDSIEIAHEALIRSWPRLRCWLTEDREGLRVHRELTEATGVWEAVDRDTGALYRGTRLARARDWAVDEDRGLTIREQAFLDASLAAETREQDVARRSTRRLRQLVALLAVLLVLAVSATVFAVSAGKTATEQRNSALSQKVAHQATLLRAANPALAVQLSLAAYQLVPGTDARGGLLSTLAMPYATQLTGHTDNVNAAVFRPDGKVLATASWDTTAKLWDVSDPHHPRELSTLIGHTGNVEGLAFSPDGRTLATGSWDHTVRIWDVTDPGTPRGLSALSAHTDNVRALAFSPDGKILATADNDSLVRLWDLTNPSRPGRTTELAGHTGTVNAVAFSPDGRLVASGGSDKIVRIWTVGSADPPRELAGHTGQVNSVSFSPDGRTLASGGVDMTARLWDVSDPADPSGLSTLTGHTGIVRSVAFRPDGRELASASVDRSVRLWNITDLRAPKQSTVLTGHTASVVSVAYSRDARTLVSSGDDHTAWLWDRPGPVLTGHDARVCEVSFSADGRLMATGGRDNEKVVKLWDTSDPHNTRELATLAGHIDGVCAVEFTPDGKTLATSSWDGKLLLWDISDPAKIGPPIVTMDHAIDVDAVAFSPDGRVMAAVGDTRVVKLWNVEDIRNPKELGSLDPHADDVQAVTFSHDGRLLATTSWDDTVRLWNVADPAHPGALSTLTGHTDAVFSVAFSPDGRTLATGGQDRTARLWDITDPRKPGTPVILTKHTDSVDTVAFSPDGRTLATSSADRTAQLWDVTGSTPQLSAVLVGHTDRLYQIAFSPDGKTLASAGSDRTVRMWQVGTDEVAARICDIASPKITPAEWAEYFPGVDYHPPCPS
ncbi:helix-turn-helix domain-containing protein [Amycolatopsis sp.]|uniref:nSTAND1 domain-containing NTPase n=1 Tax=Amycolatopsis sp. TaxID=37632 RepID=UPI002E076EF2|nr:helix-turn-helix domain-containing protein [Amycolatopsis sp.]